MDAVNSTKSSKAFLSKPVSIAVGLACLAGCAQFNPRGEGFRESFTEAAHYERPVEKSAPAFGVSQKAREIERDFGVTK